MQKCVKKDIKTEYKYSDSRVSLGCHEEQLGENFQEKIKFWPNTTKNHGFKELNKKYHKAQAKYDEICQK